MGEFRKMKMSQFPKNQWGSIVDYDDEDFMMPRKIIEMGLLPGTIFRILYQAPFGGPIYIEFGKERNRIALRISEAAYILVKNYSEH